LATIGSIKNISPALMKSVTVNSGSTARSSMVAATAGFAVEAVDVVRIIVSSA
jgi:hypothetical protein